MKRHNSFRPLKGHLPVILTLLALILAACSSQKYSVADDSVLNEYPEQEGIISAWQGIVDSAAAKDCDAFLTYTRLSLKLTEEDCEPAFAYFEGGVPEVDWDRTQWNQSKGKGKIYEVDGGSITSFILNEADGSWRTDSVFWE